MRGLRIPAVVTVTVIGVVAPIAGAISACSSEDVSPHVDAATSARGDARPADGGGSGTSDGGIADGGIADGGGAHDAGVDAVVPQDAAPDTPIT
jgi:hypothetical protein